ncbi:hypothetical protein J6590_075386 [Homalodisca vitripennis]|nr:hypothetical protein J6590_075386 [Homalodisca vitripennis]
MRYLSEQQQLRAASCRQTSHGDVSNRHGSIRVRLAYLHAKINVRTDITRLLNLC